MTDDLLIHYPFDGNVIDINPNNFHETIFGVTFRLDRFGNPNSVVYFNGINNYINLPNLFELKLNLPVSFSFWIMYDDLLYENSTVLNTSFEENVNSGIYMDSQGSTGEYQISYGDGSNYTTTYDYDSTAQTINSIADSNGEIIIVGLGSGVYDNIVVTKNVSESTEDLESVELNCYNENLGCFKTKLFFTQNNDGYNDFWNLELISNECDYTIYI